MFLFPLKGASKSTNLFLADIPLEKCGMLVNDSGPGGFFADHGSEPYSESAIVNNLTDGSRRSYLIALSLPFARITPFLEYSIELVKPRPH